MEVSATEPIWKCNKCSSRANPCEPFTVFLPVKSVGVMGDGRRYDWVIEACNRCGGKLKVIASIEEPEVIAKILGHLERMAAEPHQVELPLGARAPPQQSLLL